MFRLPVAALALLPLAAVHAQITDAGFVVVEAESQITVEADLGPLSLVDETREARGTVQATVTESGAAIGAIQITLLDIRIDDIVETGTPSFSLEDFHAEMGNGEGEVGVEVTVTNGQFIQTGNRVALEGTVTVDSTGTPVPVTLSFDLSEEEPVDLDLDGRITRVTEGFEISFPFEVTQEVDSGIPGVPVEVMLTGDVVARQVTGEVRASLVGLGLR